MRLHEVGYRYSRRGVWVLRGVTVGIEPGEIVVVRGSNGAGKSTLLGLFAEVSGHRERLLGGDYPPEAVWTI